MMQRLREAMSTINLAAMGGEGSQVQADETYHGNTSERSKSYRKGLAVYSVRLASRSSRKADIRKPPLRADCVAKVRKRLVSIFSPDGKASRDRLLI